jgi:type II secretory pathway pseudopilin PulG
MNKTSLKRSATFSGHAGFSILELLVATTIFIVVTGSIWGVLQVGQGSRAVVSQQTQTAKNIRISLNMMGRDTYNAGYGYPITTSVILPNNSVSNLLGIPPDADNARDFLPPIIPGNNLRSNTYNTTSVYTDQITLLFKDSTFNVIAAPTPFPTPTPGPTPDTRVSRPLNINAAVTNGGTGIDEIVPLSPATNAVCSVNDLYLVSGGNGSTLGVVTGLVGTDTIQFANGDPLGFNLTGSTGQLTRITTPATIQRVTMVTYFVTTDGILTRRRYVNAAPVVPAVAYVDEPLVYDVENFQIRYVMDDGTLSDNPSTNLAAIRQVRFTVSVRSRELNSAGQPYRETMTSTFSTRNLGYDAS